MSKAGKKVLILEQHDQAGGCCHSYLDKGYEFDVGIHYIGDMGYPTLTKVLSLSYKKVHNFREIGFLCFMLDIFTSFVTYLGYG